MDKELIKKLIKSEGAEKQLSDLSINLSKLLTELLLNDTDSLSFDRAFAEVEMSIEIVKTIVNNNSIEYHKEVCEGRIKNKLE